MRAARTAYIYIYIYRLHKNVKSGVRERCKWVTQGGLQRANAGEGGIWDGRQKDTEAQRGWKVEVRR